MPIKVEKALKNKPRRWDSAKREQVPMYSAHLGSSAGNPRRLKVM